MAVILYISIHFLLIINCSAGPLIKVAQGVLEGRVSKTINGKVYHSFQGIPYAKPPINELRFQSPQEPDDWQGILDATKDGNICVSINDTDFSPMGDEDCLNLSVFVHKTCTNRLLPVMFFIYGGAFNAGYGLENIYGPNWLVDEEIVLVVINYRVGAFGFLSFDIPGASGNMGLKDQVAALRWVNQNIQAFGGDPDNITIFGQSAGGASVDYLMISDLATGLFHKAIAMSGCTLNPWALRSNSKDLSMKLSKALGYPAEDEFGALHFLRCLPAYKIAPKTGIKNILDLNAGFVFLPTVEKYFSCDEPAFLNELPIAKIMAGKFMKVPLMAGFTSTEQIFRTEDINEVINEDFQRFIPDEMCLRNGSKKSLHVADMIKQFYYGDRPTVERRNDCFIQLISDVMFKTGIDNTVRLISDRSNQPVFYYRYSFDEFTPIKFISGTKYLKGAAHGDDLGFLFNRVEFYTPRDIRNVENMRRRMVKMYTNFARTGNPIPEKTNLLPIEWRPISRRCQNYLDINTELRMLTNPEEKTLQFWRDLIRNENDCRNATCTL